MPNTVSGFEGSESRTSRAAYALGVGRQAVDPLRDGPPQSTAIGACWCTGVPVPSCPAPAPSSDARRSRSFDSSDHSRAHRRTLGSCEPENTRLAQLHGFGATRSCASSCYACNTISTHGGDAGHNPLSASGILSERALAGRDTLIWRVSECGLRAQVDVAGGLER